VQRACPSGGRAKSGPPSARVRVTANIERSSLALGEHCATLGEFVEWLAQRHDDFLTLAVLSQMLRQALVPALQIVVMSADETRDDLPPTRGIQADLLLAIPPTVPEVGSRINLLLVEVEGVADLLDGPELEGEPANADVVGRRRVEHRVARGDSGRDIPIRPVAPTVHRSTSPEGTRRGGTLTTQRTCTNVDAPYPHESRGDRRAYGYEMNETQHRELAGVLASCRARVAIRATAATSWTACGPAVCV